MTELSRLDLTDLGFIQSYSIKPRCGIYYISNDKYLYINKDKYYFITEKERNNYPLLQTNNLNREIYRVNYNILFILEEYLINKLKEQEKIDEMVPTYTVYNFIKNELVLLKTLLYDYKDIEHYDIFSLTDYIITLPNIKYEIKKDIIKSTFCLDNYVR